MLMYHRLWGLTWVNICFQQVMISTVVLFIPLKHIPRGDWIFEFVSSVTLFLRICLNRKPQFWLRASRSRAHIIFKRFWCRESKLRLSIERGMHISDITTICAANQLLFCKYVSIDSLNFDYRHQNLLKMIFARDLDAQSQNWGFRLTVACT